MHVVVSGATGFLGRPLVRRLVADGHRVTVLTRRPGQMAMAGVVEEAWTPDGRAGAWAGVLDDADAVVNLAGASIAGGRWTAARKALLRSSRVDGTRSLAAALAAAPVRSRVLLSGSAVGYYGDAGDRLAVEDDPPGAGFLADLATEWERAARAAASGTTRVVIVRTGLALGRGGGALGPMLIPFRLGVGGPLSSGRQYMPWIHRDDWVSLVRFLLTTVEASGAFNATAPSPVTNEEFSRTLARVLRRPCLFRVPAVALRLALGEMGQELLLDGQRAVPARAQALGFRFQYGTLEPALRQILAGRG